MRQKYEVDIDNLDRLPQSFYARRPARVARELLGKHLVRFWEGELIGGRIIETEAYLASGDAASHSSRGKTASNASMFGPAGLLYVYPIHAKYCLNAVTESRGQGSAVLIRAIEPLWGLQRMHLHRGHQDPRRLTRGPAMICQALAVDRKLDGISLITDPRIGIFASPEIKKHMIEATTRVGISKAKDQKLRFLVCGPAHAKRE